MRSAPSDVCHLVLIARSQEVEAGPLALKLFRAADKASLRLPSNFAVAKRLSDRFAAQSRAFVGLPDRDVDSAVSTVARLVDPLLAREVAEGRWNPREQRWESPPGTWPPPRQPASPPASGGQAEGQRTSASTARLSVSARPEPRDAGAGGVETKGELFENVEKATRFVERFAQTSPGAVREVLGGGQFTGRGFVLVHGGSGSQDRESYDIRLAAVMSSVQGADRLIANGTSAQILAGAAVMGMENHPDLVAGLGCGPDADDRFLFDAWVGRGLDSRTGAMMAVERLEHPVLGALLVDLIRDQGDPVLLVGDRATRRAAEHGLELYTDEEMRAGYRGSLEYRKGVLDPARWNRTRGCDTVGAIAGVEEIVDGRLVWTLAGAASTGGMPAWDEARREYVGKLGGRAGDTAHNWSGSGVWQIRIVEGDDVKDEGAAALATGIGESTIRNGFVGKLLETIQPDVLYADRPWVPGGFAWKAARRLQIVDNEIRVGGRPVFNGVIAGLLRRHSRYAPEDALLVASATRLFPVVAVSSPAIRVFTARPPEGARLGELPGVADWVFGEWLLTPGRVQPIEMDDAGNSSVGLTGCAD